MRDAYQLGELAGEAREIDGILFNNLNVISLLNALKLESRLELYIC